jgi:hypothetical protein
VNSVLPYVPGRQRVLSLPIPLRLLLSAYPKLVTVATRLVHRVITHHLSGQAGLKSVEADSVAVTLSQRSGCSANLNVHPHYMVLDNLYRRSAEGAPEPSKPARQPTRRCRRPCTRSSPVR